MLKYIYNNLFSDELVICMSWQHIELDKKYFKKNMNILKEVENFSKNISGKIFLNYNLNKSNWFAIGGPAKVYFKPDTLEELIKFIKKFKNSLPIKVIGVGSNILVRDGGYEGVIIKLGKNFSHISKN